MSLPPRPNGLELCDGHLSSPSQEQRALLLGGIPVIGLAKEQHKILDAFSCQNAVGSPAPTRLEPRTLRFCLVPVGWSAGGTHGPGINGKIQGPFLLHNTTRNMENCDLELHSRLAEPTAGTCRGLWIE